MQTMLNCSRLVLRAVFSSNLESSSAIDFPKRNFTFGNRFPRRRQAQKAQESSLKTTSGAAVSEEKTVPASPPRLISARCGFPKDLLGGPSHVLDSDAFGDDACFVTSHKTADVLGVADGVGGWRNYGVDPGRFARSLMTMCRELVHSEHFRPSRPQQLLANAYHSLQTFNAEKPDKRLLGSSTACVVVLERGSGWLHTANLGDSGFLVLRDGAVVHRSLEQCHYFNTPFQLALTPSDEVSFLSDSPESAATSSFPVREGDLVLLATDGLFDNLPAKTIEQELGNCHELNATSLQAVCNSLALQARRLAFDQEFMSPFAEKAQSQGIPAAGGKPDDITILLALVTADNCPPTTSQ